MIKKFKYLIITLIMMLIPSLNCNARVMSQTDFSNLNISSAYVVGNYVFDIMKYNPTLKDLMTAARTIEGDDVEIIKVQMRNGVAQYTKVFENTVHSGFPEIDVKTFVTNINNKKNESSLYGTIVKFYDDSLLLEELELNEDGKVEPPSNTIKTGYNFVNWYTDKNYDTLFNFNNVINSNTNVYGKWESKSYQIVFNDNTIDTVSNMPNNINAKYNSFEKLNKIPVREGYTFLGWSTNRNATEPTYSYNATLPNLTVETGIVNLYAIWGGYKYTISYNTRSSSIIDDLEVVSGADYELDIPTRIGYTFVGWTLDENDDLDDYSLVSNNEVLSTIEDDVVSLYALWRPNEYNIVLKSDETTTFDTLTFEYDTNTVSPVTTPTKLGYKVFSWKDYYQETYNQYLGNDFVFGEAMPAYDITLYPNFVPIAYTILLNVNGGDDLENTSIDSCYTCTDMLPEVIKENYKFLGWSLDPDDSTGRYSGYKNFRLSTVDESTVTLYAIFEPESYDLIYKIDENNVFYRERYHYLETQVEYETEPTKLGYTFNGWVTSYNGDIAYPFDIMPFNDVSIYASWTANKYNILFDENGGSDVSDLFNISYDSEYNLPTTSKEGSTFIGWSINEDATSAEYSEGLNNTNLATTGTVTLYAVWSNSTNIYTIEFDKNNLTATGSMASKTCVSGESCQLPTSTTFSYNYHHIIGWSLEPDTTVEYENGDTITLDKEPGSTVTLYAIWDVDILHVIYNKNNNLISPDNWNVEDLYESIVMPSITLNDPSDLYTDNGAEHFVSWNTKPDGSGISYDGGQRIESIRGFENNELVLYAQWERVVHDVHIRTSDGVYMDYNTLNGSSDIYHGDIIDESLLEEYKAYEGYTFVDWYQYTPFSCRRGHYEDDNYICDEGHVPETISSEPFDFSTPITEDISITAVMTPITYNLVLNHNYLGSVNETYENIAYDSTKIVDIPVRPGYIFKGWGRNVDDYGFGDITSYMDGDLTVSFERLTTIPNNTVTLYAIWEAQTATFIGAGRACLRDSNYNCIIENGNTLLDDYYTDNYFHIIIANGEAVISNNSFDDMMLNDPGYTFENWYKLDEYSNCTEDSETAYCINDSYTVNKTPIDIESDDFVVDGVYAARFVEKNYTINYDLNNNTDEVAPNSSIINFNTNNFALPDITSMVNSGTITAPLNASFAGWYFIDEYDEMRIIELENNIEFINSYILNNINLNTTTITLYALWSYSQVNIEFDINDDDLGTTDYSLVLYNNQTFTLPDSDDIEVNSSSLTELLTDSRLLFWNLNPEGYDIGWSVNEIIEIEDIEYLFPIYEPSIKLYAQYSPNVVDVSYEAYTGSSLPTTDRITHGSSFTFPENDENNTITSPSGMHFVGWHSYLFHDEEWDDILFLPGQTIDIMDYDFSDSSVTFEAVYINDAFDASKNYVIDSSDDLDALTSNMSDLEIYATKESPITITIKKNGANDFTLDSTLDISKNMTLIIDEETVLTVDTALIVYGTLKLHLTDSNLYNIKGDIQVYDGANLYVNDVLYIGKTGAIELEPTFLIYNMFSAIFITVDDENIINVFGNATINGKNNFNETYPDNTFTINEKDKFIIEEGSLTVNYATVIKGTIVDASLENSYIDNSQIIINDIGDGTTMTIDSDATFDDNLKNDNSNWSEVTDNRE